MGKGNVFTGVCLSTGIGGSPSGGAGVYLGDLPGGSSSKEGLPRGLGGSSPRGKGGLHPVGLDRPPPELEKWAGRHPTGMLSF